MLGYHNRTSGKELSVRTADLTELMRLMLRFNASPVAAKVGARKVDNEEQTPPFDADGLSTSPTPAGRSCVFAGLR